MRGRALHDRASLSLADLSDVVAAAVPGFLNEDRGDGRLAGIAEPSDGAGEAVLIAVRLVGPLVLAFFLLRVRSRVKR